MVPQKAFIKPFEAPQRSVKIKILWNFFSLRPGLGREGLNVSLEELGSLTES